MPAAGFPTAQLLTYGLKAVRLHSGARSIEVLRYVVISIWIAADIDAT
jgi:hypothetical protein